MQRTDNPNELCTRLAAAIASVSESPQRRPWNERIILAAWNAEFVAACLRHIPGFQVALTTASPAYATAMLPVPGLHFSLLNYSFATSRGARFRRAVREQPQSQSQSQSQPQQPPRKIFSWSDNVEEWMEKSIRNGVDGVITDDPKLFLELCSRWEESSDVAPGKDGRSSSSSSSRLTVKERCLWVVINVLVWIIDVVSGVRHGSLRVRVKEEMGGMMD